jgi:hypothetical protein
VTELDKIIIEHLVKDEVFIASIEENFGEISEIQIDYQKNKLIYILKYSGIAESNLDEILKKLKEINYQGTFLC